MTTDLDFGTSDDHNTASRAGVPPRSPAMRTYCSTLSRFTSAVQSTEQLLRNDDAGTREDTEQRELTATTRLRGIDRAASAAADGLAHCATVRSTFGLPADAVAPAGGPAFDLDGRALGAGSEDAWPALDDDAARGRRGRAGGRPDHDALGTIGRSGEGVPGTFDPDHGPRGGAPELPFDDRPPEGGTATPRPGPARAVRPEYAAPGATVEPDPRSPGATAVRSESALVHEPADRPVDPAPGLDRLRRTGGADLGVALTALGRRRDELKLAETDFERWLASHDERSRKITLGAAVAAGVAGVAVMAVAGARTSAATALALLIVCTLAVVAVGLGVAAARRLPRVCRGAGLARRPDGVALARYGARIGGTALLALTAANIAAGAL
ncbi:hypothetical protein [Jiangella alkaliphila]|uniref:Uncharacterized protein n=1 Tax=Jiangella alkaliphila TaxID=419479 RepID=A0A1H2HLD4_9ACTN|nr:hypothetical protein [Jiangella alkaliphila]SDU32701.1 hypothetical protein SAMN04488563_1114 [Jiangella alkaliphila]